MRKVTVEISERHNENVTLTGYTEGRSYRGKQRVTDLMGLCKWIAEQWRIVTAKNYEGREVVQSNNRPPSWRDMAHKLKLYNQLNLAASTPVIYSWTTGSIGWLILQHLSTIVTRWKLYISVGNNPKLTTMDTCTSPLFSVWWLTYHSFTGIMLLLLLQMLLL